MTVRRRLLPLLCATTALAAVAAWSPASVAAPKGGPSVLVEQCANGPADAVRACDSSGKKGAWTATSISPRTSHWTQGDSVPIRAVIGGLTVGSSDNTVQVRYSSLDAGVHSVDYLTSFDRTDTLAEGNNPCAGVDGCSLGTFTTFPIPIDQRVTEFQQPGVLTMFGSTITSVSAYTVEESGGGETTSFTVTFTANQSTVVLAWGAHIAAPVDHGQGQTTADTDGSRFVNGASLRGGRVASVSATIEPVA